ncbi:alpha/beta hydrolase [Streptomyces sp. NPDC056161]|uniref:alpha/beta hydrolase n=1 Tax=Streptomyces sp. NPDC056161 TaxID=3345732 RepID=UPI0035DD2AA7
MNDIAELKDFAVLHARAQKISGLTGILAGIADDAEGSPTSWAVRWSEAGDVLRERGRLLEAVRHYTMARFPFVDGPARRRAHDLAVETFARWAPEYGLERVTVKAPDGDVACWATGLSASRPRPLIVTCGGIVSSKEQWAPALAAVRRFGFAAVVLELPGVGENTLPYTAESWRLLPALLDTLGPVARTEQTYAMALSFSGHLALRAAADDPRIRGVVTAGAPLWSFFTDHAWLSRVPRLTLETLAHHVGVPVAELPDALASWGLDADRISRLDIPIAYAASTRDEIIPSADPAWLRAHARHLDLLEHDDVHGSPDHVAHTRLWAMVSLLRMHGVRGPRVGALGLLLRAAARSGRRGTARVGAAAGAGSAAPNPAAGTTKPERS